MLCWWSQLIRFVSELFDIDSLLGAIFMLVHAQTFCLHFYPLSTLLPALLLLFWSCNYQISDTIFLQCYIFHILHPVLHVSTRFFACLIVCFWCVLACSIDIVVCLIFCGAFTHFFIDFFCQIILMFAKFCCTDSCHYRFVVFCGFRIFVGLICFFSFVTL